MPNKKENIFCPTCQTKDTWTPENTFRPFCSARCKLIDLGEWAAEKHSIPGEPINPNLVDESNNENFKS